MCVSHHYSRKYIIDPASRWLIFGPEEHISFLLENGYSLNWKCNISFFLASVKQTFIAVDFKRNNRSGNIAPQKIHFSGRRHFNFSAFAIRFGEYSLPIFRARCFSELKCVSGLSNHFVVVSLHLHHKPGWQQRSHLDQIPPPRIAGSSVGWDQLLQGPNTSKRRRMKGMLPICGISVRVREICTRKIRKISLP